MPRPFCSRKSSKKRVRRQQVAAAATEMTRLLLSMALLSTVMSEHLVAKDRREVPSHVVFERLWPGRGILIPRGVHALDPDEKRSRRNEAARKLFEGPPQTSPFALISGTNPKKQFTLSDLQNPDSTECCDGIKPMLLLSIDLRKMLEGVERISESCSSGNCRVHQGWTVQEPFYVDEPNWIEINADYSDSFTEIDKDDPYFVSRGKKIHRLKNDLMADQFDDYEIPSQDNQNLNIITKNYLRTRRSITPRELHEKFNKLRRNRRNEKKDERNSEDGDNNRRYIENLVKIYERDEDPFYVSRGKKIKIPNNHVNDKKDTRQLSSTNFDLIHEKEGKISTEIIRNKRSLEEIENSPTINDEGKENPLQDKNVITNEKFVQNKNKIRNNNSIQNNDQNRSKHSQSDNENSPEENLAETKEISREKRSVCEDLVCKEEATTQKTPSDNFKAKNRGLLKEVEDALNDFDYLDRRDKHAELLDILGEPFFISRGKKKSRDTEIDEFHTKQREIQAKVNFYDELMDDIAANIMKLKILGTLIQHRTRCLTEDCESDRIVKRKPPRDRRGALDDLLAKQDPFYVARGKRAQKVETDTRVFKTPINDEDVKLKDREIDRSYLIGRRNGNQQ